MYDTRVWCLEQGVNLFYREADGITLHQIRCWPPSRRTRLCHAGWISATLDPGHGADARCCLARGPISHAVVRFYKNQIAPFTGAIDHMLDDGTHAIDTLRWICGGEAESIDSTVARSQVPDINVITPQSGSAPAPSVC